MRALTFPVLLLLPVLVQSQTFADEMTRCGEEFHARFARTESQNILQAYRELGRCVEGHQLPDFLVTDLSGKTYTHADLTGKVVWLNFWFIACPPCQAELPIIEEIYQQYKDKDFILLTLAVDKPAALQSFMEKKQLHYPVVAESEPIIQDTLHMTFDFFPTNIFLDKSGKIIKFKPGGPIDGPGIQHVKTEFMALIDAALDEQP